MSGKERQVIIREYFGARRGIGYLKGVFFSSQSKENKQKTKTEHAKERHPGRMFSLPIQPLL